MGAMIAPNVNIGEGAVVAGNPAKIVKYRDGNHFKKLREKEAYYKYR